MAAQRSPRSSRFQERQAAQARKRRDKVEATAVPRMARAVSKYFAGMAQRLEARLPREATKELKESAPSALVLAWGTEEARLYDVLRQEYVRISEGAFADASDLMGTTIAFNLNSRGMERVIGNLGAQVKGITDESRSRLQSIIKTGIDNGDHPFTIGKTMLQSVQGWAGLEDLTRSRAMTIARTETAHAYTWASMAAYRDSGIVRKVVCHDSPDCGWNGHNDSELANGTHRGMDEAETHPTSHPNCVRAFSPAFGEEAAGARERKPTEPPKPADPLPPGVRAHTLRRSQGVLDGTNPAYVTGFGRRIGGDAMKREWEELSALTGRPVDDLQAQAAALMQRELDGRTLGTYRTSRSAERIIKEGRFKSQFETQNSGGILDPAFRARREGEMFGYADDLPVQQRPIYGTFRSGKPTNSWDDGAGYGDVHFELSAAARARSTAIWEDSLSSAVTPTPANAVNAGSLPGTSASFFNNIQPTYGYIEAQIHGGLTMGDVAKVTFTTRPTVAVADALRAQGFQEATLDALEWVRP